MPINYGQGFNEDGSLVSAMYMADGGGVTGDDGYFNQWYQQANTSDNPIHSIEDARQQWKGLTTDWKGRNIFGTAGGMPTVGEPSGRYAKINPLPDTPEYAGWVRAGTDPREMMNTGTFFPQAGLTWDMANNPRYDDKYGILLPQSIVDNQSARVANYKKSQGEDLLTYGPLFMAALAGGGMLLGAGALGGAGAAGLEVGSLAGMGTAAEAAAAGALTGAEFAGATGTGAWATGAGGALELMGDGGFGGGDTSAVMADSNGWGNSFNRNVFEAPPVDAYNTNVAGSSTGGLSQYGQAPGLGGGEFATSGAGMYGSVGQPLSWLDQIQGGLSQFKNSEGFKTAKGIYDIASPLNSLYSGYQGLQRSRQLDQLGQQAQLTGNPWGASGGQAMASGQLMSLMNGNVQDDPAYKLRIQAAQRAMGPMGQRSGAMAVAGANASTDWYNGRLQQLGQLAGAPGDPLGAAQLGINASKSATDIMLRALGTFGFAGRQMFGGQQQASPEIVALLKSLGLGG